MNKKYIVMAGIGIIFSIVLIMGCFFFWRKAQEDRAMIFARAFNPHYKVFIISSEKLESNQMTDKWMLHYSINGEIWTAFFKTNERAQAFLEYLNELEDSGNGK